MRTNSSSHCLAARGPGYAIVEFLIKLLLVVQSRLKSLARLEADMLVRRQQVIVLTRKPRSRVRLRNIDRLSFVWIYRRLWLPKTSSEVKKCDFCANRERDVHVSD